MSTSGQDRIYQLTIREHLTGDWSASFSGLDLIHPEAGGTLLTGPIRDQAELHGILARIRDLGLTLVALQMLDHEGHCRNEP